MHRRSFELLLPGAQMALGRIIGAMKWPRVVETIRGLLEDCVPGTYCYSHIECCGQGDTPEDALITWRLDVERHLTDSPEWLWWREFPEIEAQIDFEKDKLFWFVRSRMTLPTSLTSFSIVDEQSRQNMRARLRDAVERDLLPDFGG